MNICKTYHLANSQGAVIRPKLIEFVDDNELSVFTWPSALILAAFVQSNAALVVGKNCLELGAGTALPSIVAGLCGAKSVIVSDRSTEPAMMGNIQNIIALNSLKSVCTARPLDWGPSDGDLLPAVDIVFGADVLYSTEAFDSVLLSFVSCLAKNPCAVFYTTYQERRYVTLSRRYDAGPLTTPVLACIRCCCA